MLNRSIGNKIIALVLIINCITMGVFFVIATGQMDKLGSASVNQVDELLRDEFDRMIKYEVETVVSLLEEMNHKIQRGEIGLEEGKTLAADLIRELRYSDTADGYFWVDTSKGVNVVLLGRQNVEGTSRIDLQDVNGKYIVKELIENAQKPGGDYTDYWFPKPGEEEALPKRGYSLYFKPFDWVIGTGAYVDDIDVIVDLKQASISDRIQQAKGMFVTFSAIIIIVSIAFTYILSKKMAKPIIVTADYAERIADLDITRDIPEVYMARKDEIGRLANSFQSINNSLRGFIHEITEASQQVATSSEGISSIAQQSAVASEEVAKTIEEIAQSASEQARDTEKGAMETKALEEILQQDQSYLKEVNTSTQKVVELKEEGFNIIHQLIEKTQETSEAIKRIHEVIIETNKSSEKISNASGMIHNIAEQTNLLALNAAIEAARAGEAGRGFTVVAGEIRKLAEQSNQFTGEIQEIVKDLQQKSHTAVNTMKNVESMVMNQARSVDETKDKFNGISHAIENTKDSIVQLNESAVEIEEKKNQMIEIIENLSAISEENAAGTQEASASIEEQAASVEEIANASENLAMLALKLQQAIGKFKI